MKPYAKLKTTSQLLALSCAATLATLQSHAQQKKDEPTAAEKRGTTTPASVQPAVAPAVSGGSQGAEPEEPIMLSPFEVSTVRDRGYQATNTMSGTRLNSRLEDLGASITVVTKQQLMDTASVDINDIFLYEANTEGAFQYTEPGADRSGIPTDVVQDNPAGANRVRGLGSVNLAVGGYASASNIPIDTYNIDAVEISRGSNSTLFGLGELSGSVNIRQAQADTRKTRSQVVGRIDSYGGWRTSIDLNRPIIEGKLALRVSAVHEEKGYVRKPNRDDTNRVYGAITFTPFKYTTLRANYESVHNFARRPNTITPRDFVSYWRDAGSPTWDPITQTAKWGNGNTRVVTSAQEDAGNLPPGLARGFSSFWNRPSMFIDNGQVELYTVNRTSTSASPGNALGTLRYVQNGMPLAPLFIAPGVSDKSIYDWTSVNFAAPNYVKSKSDAYNVELEQFFLSTPNNTLAVQLGFRREDADRYSRNFIGQTDGAPSLIQIDVNERLLDGRTNPYFLRPYMGGTEPQIRRNPSLNDTYRATLGYQTKLADRSNWIKWLGDHNFALYTEAREIINNPSGLRYRDNITSTHTWFQPPAVPTNANNLTTAAVAHLYPRYYMGDAVGQNIDYAPVPFNNTAGEFTLRWFNATTGQWVDEKVSIGEVGSVPQQGMQKQIIRTLGGVWQGSFLNGRIIPTFGYRDDRSTVSTSRPGVLINPDGLTSNTDGLFTFGNNKTYRAGLTRNQGVVIKPLKWLSFHYNRADSFKPEGTNRNVFQDFLPNSNGETEDYGFSLSFADGKFWTKLNHYESVQTNSRVANTISSRVLRLDFDSSAGGSINNDMEDWFSTNLAPLYDLTTPAGVAAHRAAVLSVMQTDEETIASWQSGPSVADTQDARSTGYELEINYNPTRFWTMKLTGAQQEAVNSNISTYAQEYINKRLSIWQNARLPNDVRLATAGPGGSDIRNRYWWTQSATSNTIAAVPTDGNIPINYYSGSNILAPLKLETALQNKQRPQTRKYSGAFTTNYRFSNWSEFKYLKNLSVGGSLRWQDKGAIGFYLDPTKVDADGLIREYDANRPIYDKSHFSGDVWAGYNLRLFNDKVRCLLQLNVRNVQEDGGRLRVFGVNPDGSPANFRILDPRQFILTATFEL